MPHLRAGEPLKILVVHGDVPPIDRDACSQRLSRIIELLVDAGHRVTLIGRAGFNQEREAERLLARGVEQVIQTDRDRLLERHGQHPQLMALPAFDLQHLLRDGRFDLAWLSLYDVAEQYLPIIRAVSPATKIVVDSTDIHWVREHRGAELADDPGRIAEALRTRAREAAVYSAADANVAISSADAAATSELAPDVPVHVVSQVQPFPALRSRVPGDRGGALFVGNFRHAPNADAILWFHATAWPLIRAAVPGAHLTIVGTEPPPEVVALQAPDVTVTGWVAELEPYLARARVSVAPLRYGAGVKGKISEAVAAGIPVVSTTIGIEGMELEDGRHCLVADAPVAFAEAVGRVCSDDALWTELVTAAHEQLERSLGMSASALALEHVLTQTVPARWQAPADAPWLAELLKAYAGAWSSEDHVTLVLTVPATDPDALTAAFDRVSEAAAALELDLDQVADIELTAWSAEMPVPARTAVLTDGPPSAWRMAASA